MSPPKYPSNIIPPPLGSRFPKVCRVNGTGALFKITARKRFRPSQKFSFTIPPQFPEEPPETSEEDPSEEPTEEEASEGPQSEEDDSDTLSDACSKPEPPHPTESTSTGESRVEPTESGDSCQSRVKPKQGPT